jgi:rRNA biogenesis protein RRP5
VPPFWERTLRSADGCLQAAEEIYQKAVKKFSQHSDVWTLFAEFYFHRGDAEAARALLPRSLKSLPTSERE